MLSFANKIALFKPSRFYSTNLKKTSNLLFRSTNVNLRYGPKEILNDVNFGICRGDRIVVVGSNGAGKSSLARIVSKEITSDSGQLYFSDNIRIEYLPQDLYSFAKSEKIVKFLIQIGRQSFKN